jgi:hypothetical protein
LLWLLRGLSFTCKSLQFAQANKDKELSAAFSHGYDNSLKEFHKFVTRGIFSVALKAVPYRKDFYAKLGYGPDGDPELDEWLASLSKIVTNLQDYSATNGYDKDF